ncbi:hypothetical protein CTM88_20725 [Photobacterium aquimaris]|uniref:Transposase zinc-ribbon domain-containing protein n=1 Tax=Photobacterium aquimaris TaxID=512643 RepID=A0A2T3IEC3_9GAMM|nr:hypothetical protein CTM88_20725 [Photobacterium aquimaris]
MLNNLNQKDFSISEFLEIYGTEEQCRKLLFNLRWGNGYVCPKCGSKKYCEIKSRNLFQCNNCHYQTSLTADTIFSHSKIPLTTWFLAIFLISKYDISSLELSRKLRISYNSTWRLRHKLMKAMKTDTYNFITIKNVYRSSRHKNLSDQETQNKLAVKTPTGTKEKHINRYFSEFCFKFNRGNDIKLIIKHLIQQCVYTDPNPDSVLKLRDDNS